MGYLSKKQTLWSLLIALVCFHSSCQKEEIAPPNQSLAFVKYFGHVGDQKGADLIQTADGGYIMVGATNSFTTQQESDVFIVKTDALGNELWSTSLGKAAGPGTGISSGKYVRYDEEGVKIVELPDASGYVVATNRTYYEYLTPSSVDRVALKSKVVMYLLDPAGVPTVIDGTELRTTTNFTEKVSDLKIDTTVTPFLYVITGYTTDLYLGKTNAGGPNDKTDIFTALLDENFGQLWNTLSLAYGFDGEDYGASVHIMPDGYLVTGTSQKGYLVGNDSIDIARFIAVKMKKVNGTGVNPEYYGDQNYTCEGGYSVYDDANKRITITGAIVDGVNAGHAVLLQTNDILATQTSGPFGFKFFKPIPQTKLPLLALNNRYTPKSIAMLPNSQGFLVSMTHQKNPSEYNVAVMKVGADLDAKEDWAYFFGYEDLDRVTGTDLRNQEAAGTVMPITSQVGTTNQRELKGYMVTGTFHLGTNNMIGLIKMNLNGELKP